MNAWNKSQECQLFSGYLSRLVCFPENSPVLLSFIRLGTSEDFLSEHKETDWFENCLIRCLYDLIGNVVSLFYETMKQETGIRRYLILCWWGSGRDKRFLWRIKSSNFRFLYEAFVIVALKEDSCRNYSLVHMLYDGFIDYYVGSAQENNNLDFAGGRFNWVR